MHLKSARYKRRWRVPGVKILAWGGILSLVLLWAGGHGLAQKASHKSAAPPPTVLSKAVICEGIENQRPVNAGWVFSVKNQKIYCLTTFEDIENTQFILHRWYFRDNPVATFRLALQPPIWSTYSSLQIRDMDKGPWRVAITDTGGQQIQELRFSVTE